MTQTSKLHNKAVSTKHYRLSHSMSREAEASKEGVAGLEKYGERQGKQIRWP